MRKRRRRTIARIGFGALALALLPSTIGFQDLGALLARQPAVAERARAPDRVAVRHHSRRHVQHAAAGRHRDPASADLCAGEFRSGRHHRLDRRAAARRFRRRRCNFPTVNRKTKARLAVSRAREPLPPLPPILAIQPVPESAVDAAKSLTKRAAASSPIRNTNSRKRRSRGCGHRRRSALCRYSADQSHRGRAQRRRRQGCRPRLFSAPIRWPRNRRKRSRPGRRAKRRW